MARLAVWSIPKFLSQTCEFLAGKEISAHNIRQAEGILQTEIAPISDARGTIAYKRLLARQLFFAHFITLFPKPSNARFVMINIDAQNHVKGQSIYLDDIQELQGTLYALPFDATVAHAKIVSIDLEAARQSQGIVAILTAKGRSRRKPDWRHHSR
jgi:hypothetical protein